ncbi:MAG: hypothetical protein NTZ56_06610 [Acidobacteria bacterium]|nr:hypothetical protein [Acidobacteriota bacterium]
MHLECPHCGAHDPRVPSQRSAGERLASLFGLEHVQCRACRRRYWSSLWLLREIAYAHCPYCYRSMDLTTWSEKYVQPRTSQKWAMALGAKRVRCASCRCNFVSFRRVRSRAAAATPPAEQRGTVSALR